MSQKLYVGGLPISFSKEDLMNLFGRHGVIDSARIITNGITGESRGFGFIEMANKRDASNAIHHLNGAKVGEKVIIVTSLKAKPSFCL